MICPSCAGAARSSGPAASSVSHTDALIESRAARGARFGGGVLLDREGVDLGRPVVVHEQVWPEPLVQPLQQSVVHGGAGESDRAHGAEIAAGAVGMPEQVVVQRGHEVEGREALRGDRPQRRAGVELRQAHEAAVDERHGEERPHPHRVIQRHDAERALAAAVQVLRHVGDRGGPLVAMAPRHAFRPAGGPRRVQHQRHV